jgi:peptide/nickel transport system permease protein
VIVLARYLLRRVLHAVFLLAGVSILSFAFVDLAPGDYLTDARLNPQVSATTVAGLRSEYGLDHPLPVRYASWLRSALRGDFGVSMAYGLPASQLLFPRVRNTLLLAASAVALTWLLGVPLGVWSAGARRRWPDRIIGFGASAALAIPELVMATVALFVAVRSGLLPVGGNMVLPVFVLVAGSIPVVIRHTRAAVLDVMNAPFVVAARTHGIAETTIIWRYAMRAALNPLISLGGLSIGTLLSASLLVEVIMGWPGLGPLLLDAVSARDVHVIIGSVVLSAALLIGGSLLADILLYACDPRIRVEP